MNLQRAVLGGVMAWTDLTQRRPLLRATVAPGRVQDRLLLRILRDNAATAFGKRHGFAAIKDWRDFRAAVPVQTYEDLRGDIDAQAASGASMLTMARPVGYARTSGTTGMAKDIPITTARRVLDRYVQMQTALTLFQQTDFFAGDIIALGSPAADGQRLGGTYGAASGQAYDSLPSLLRRRFVVPKGVFEIADYDLKYYVVALLGLAAGRVTGLATANPSTIVRLRDTVTEHRAALLDDLQGRPSGILNGLEDGLRLVVDKRLRSAKVGRSVALLTDAVPMTVARLWPQLRAILTWTGGSCGVALRRLRDELPASCKVTELGYRASETVGTITVDAETNVGVPTLCHTVFEFAPRAAWEATGSGFLTLAELEVGEQYYVFVTTSAGLYRYEMNDIVEVTGRLNNTPTLAFVQKGQGITNITGEKLSEADVIWAAEQVLQETLGAELLVVLGDEEARQYELLLECRDGLDAGWLEAQARAFDTALRRRNNEYDAKRASGRLGVVRATALRYGVADHCKREALKRGQREAQYKPVCLALRRDWPADLEPYVVARMGD